ncbi:unnamed protein product [Effrenium voratum]|uniref:Uncharacterized protein n=1 Tax=Effrenium voratum TaxID=2562239 RepID=A0AA36JPM4_9DINO|nr:unnamed protein product [Effrenium voratum]CAJ1425449.1 unnamed protein product [Effrenium voratum]
MTWRSALITGGLIAWLSWLWFRYPQVSKKEILAALERWTAECRAVFAEIAAVTQAKEAKESGEEPFSEVLDQPLLLAHGLRSAAAHAALTLPGDFSGEDLETIFHSYSDEPQVRRVLSDMQQQHEACLEGVMLPGENCWLAHDRARDAEAILRVLRDLGSRRASKLAQLDQVKGGLGPAMMRCCEEAEEEFWAEKFPGNEIAKLSFGPAVATFLANASFKDRCSQLETELAGQC